MTLEREEQGVKFMYHILSFVSNKAPSPSCGSYCRTYIYSVIMSPLCISVCCVCVTSGVGGGHQEDSAAAV